MLSTQLCYRMMSNCVGGWWKGCSNNLLRSYRGA